MAILSKFTKSRLNWWAQLWKSYNFWNLTKLPFHCCITRFCDIATTQNNIGVFAPPCTLELCWLVVLKTECSQSCCFMSYRFPRRFESVKRKDSCSPSKLGNFIRDSLESQKNWNTVKSKKRKGIVLSAAQYSQVIWIFDMFTSCSKTLSDPRRNHFITKHLEFWVISLNVMK